MSKILKNETQFLLELGLRTFSRKCVWAGRQICLFVCLFVCEFLRTNWRVSFPSHAIHTLRFLSSQAAKLDGCIWSSQTDGRTDSLSHQIRSKCRDWDLNQDHAVKLIQRHLTNYSLLLFFLVLPVLDRQVKWILPLPPTPLLVLPLQILLTFTETISL